MKKSLLFLNAFLLIAVLSCGQSKADRLKAAMVENPTTQADKDKNLILQHAIDNNLDVESTESGIYYVMEKAGEGDASPDMQSMVTAHYHGTLLDGTVFDSSVERGEPFQFQLGGVVRGWQEAIPMLKKGGKGKFIIPSGLAYGPRAAGKIPANSVLIFDIELVDFASFAEMQSKQKETDQKLIEEHLAANEVKAESTESGIFYAMEKEGTGDAQPTATSKVTVHYTGKLLNGKVFDSSVERGEPITFGLNQVIPGWQEAIPLLKKGGKATFYIPSGLAYGPRGAGGAIPPNSVLIFEVELIDFQ